jgi:hypothetical protein
MVNQTRQPRELDNRETEQRTQQWAPAATLPEITPQPGWKHRWVRSSMVGQSDATNVSKRMREGWEPVKLTEYPELQYFVDKNSRLPDSIEVGGLILMKAPEGLVEQRNAYYNRQADAQAQAVDNSFMKENDSRMPLFKERRTEVKKFGKG